MAVSTVYILIEWYFEEAHIVAVFATPTAAEMAKLYYERRRMALTRGFGMSYEIQKREVLDQTPISKSERPEAPAVGEGLDPEHIPEAGA
jgi:hypothetical protein